MYKFELEKGSRKFVCPNCSQKTFVYYVSNKTGKNLSSDVGRCDRESNCGYHRTPKEYFADNPQVSKEFVSVGTSQKTHISNNVFPNKNGTQAIYEAETLTKKPDFIPKDILLQTLANYDHNNFVQFLNNLFPNCLDEIQRIICKRYLIGTFPNDYGAYTCFPYIDRQRRICKAKLIRFDRKTGKRLKGEFDTSSLSAKVKLGKNYKQIFFGEHLLSNNQKPVAIVEAEKTAVIASICIPEFIWLAIGSKQSLKAGKLKRLGQRKIVLYPDADGFARWTDEASQARLQGLDVKVSDLIERLATDAEKGKGFDIADYLINRQKEINQCNYFINFYNSKLEKVLNDEKLFENFETILDEQKAVLMINGGLPENEAEIQVMKFDNLREIVLSV